MRSSRPLASFHRSRRLVLVLGLFGVLAGLGSAQILQVAETSITAYPPTSTSAVQGARPLHQQRAVNVDGSARALGTLPVSIAGNPFESAWGAHARLGNLDLSVGAYSPLEVDIALPTTGFSWQIARTYNARQQNSSNSPIDSTGSAQGVNWFQTSQPEIVFFDSSTNSEDTIVLLLGADRYSAFRRKDSNSSQFQGVDGTSGCFDLTIGGASLADTWKLTDQRGTVVTFFGFDADAGVAAGQIWKIVDAAGNTAYVGHATTAATAISTGYDADGRILVAVDPDDRRFSYSYSTLDGVKRLTQVKAETKTGGTWSGSPTGVATIAQVDYAYYTSEDHGDPGDLKLVTVTKNLTESSVAQTLTTLYRYWEDSYDSSSSPGYPHALKYVYSAEGTRRYDWLDSTFNQGFLSASDASLEPYAGAYFEYDSSHRVRKAWFNGGCGCSGASNGAHQFTYEALTYSHTMGYDPDPASRTLIQRPDGSFVTQYFDETGQALSQVVTDIVPTSSSPTPQKWVTRVVRDANGCVTAVHTPANCSAYDHSTGEVTSSEGAGLVQLFTRESAGTLRGFATARLHQEGTEGTGYFDERLTFDTDTCLKTITDVTLIRPLLATRRSYPVETDDADTGYLETTMSYAAWADAALSVETATTVMPTVTAANNGPDDVGDTLSRHFRKDGLVDFERRFFDPSLEPEDDDRNITYFEYSHGQVVRHALDADTADSGVVTVSVPDGFASLEDAPVLTKVTNTTLTATGLKDQETPVGTGQKTDKVYYTRLGDQRLAVLRYGHFDASTYYGPVEFQVFNQAGKVEVSGKIALTGNSSSAAQSTHVDEFDADPITAVDTDSSAPYDFGQLAQMTTYLYDESGTELQEERRYFSLPSSGAGSEGTHYDATRYGYDDSGRRVRVKEASGTIRRTSYDLFGRATEQFIGTNDHGFVGGESSGPDNMVKTEKLEFDLDHDGGNGLLTKRTLYVEDSTTGQRVTDMHHDYRGRMVWEEPPSAPYTVNLIDNLGRTVASGQYSSSSGLSTSTDPTSEATNRQALTESFYDEQGRVWKTLRHKIDEADGSDDDSLANRTWYDRLGRVVKTNGSGGFRKTRYDRLGRVTDEFDLASDDDAAYANVLDVAGDIVLEQHETRYDPVLDTVVLRVWISRFLNNYGVSETTGALDTNADGNGLIVTADDIVKGRVQISASWYDTLKRETSRVELGTNSSSGNVADYDRTDPGTVPSRSDTVLRTDTAYDTDGTVQTVTDPRGKVAKFVSDALGRRTKEIRNYDAGVNSGNPSGTDGNVTVAYGYANGLRTTLTADLPSGQTDQVTTYTFGTVKGASAGDSKIATGHLLQKVAYPDSSESSDAVTFAYNAQGQEIWKKDQATTSPAAGGNVFESDYDTRGRATQKRVTTLGTGFDGAVRRIATTFDSLGRVQLVTQFDNATVGSGSVVDEVKYSYEDWGNLEKFEQDRNSAVGAGGSVDDYEVSYTWAKTTVGRHAIQKATETLPSGKVLTFKYRDRNGLHDKAASRVTEIADGDLTLVAYDYNGLGEVVRTAYPEPNVACKQHSGSGSSTTFPDLDRFNRVVKSRWTKGSPANVDFYHVELTYDRNSSITSADDQVHAGFDVKYAMDDIDRLTDADEGTLSGGSIGSRTRREQWTLSQTGNWNEEKLDLNGDGDWSDTDEVDDCRTHNDVNELTARNTNCSGGNEFTLAYDPAGDMTDDGKDYKYEWDAFYRLRKVKNQSNSLVAEYRYNGLGFRIAEHADTDTDADVDSNDKWFYDAFDERWRQVARFREDDTSPKEEFVHHQAGLDGRAGSSYIDLVVCRYKDANMAWTSASDGTLEERIYYCQNQHADVVALISSAGSMIEWVKYSAYGVPCGLPGGDTDSDGDCDSTDVAQVQTWINGSAYDVRGDVDLDGDVDATDKSGMQSTPYSGTQGGRGTLSSIAFNHRAYSGSAMLRPVLASYRRRLTACGLGRWYSRDVLRYTESANLYQYVGSRPINRQDAQGTLSYQVGISADVIDTIGSSEAFPQAIRSEGGCCDRLSPPYGGSVGFTACCFGKLVICDKYPYCPLDGPDITNTAAGVIHDCIVAHERIHINSPDLAPCGRGVHGGQWNPLYNDSDKRGAEVGASWQESDCVRSRIDECEAEGQYAAECKQNLTRRMNEIDHYANVTVPHQYPN